MAKNEVRYGKISSIDYEAGTAEVTYPDRDDTVTKQLCFISNREYCKPKVDDLVIVLHPGAQSEDGCILGTIWNDENVPPEGYEGLYRKDYDLSAGVCYFRYDANVPEDLFHEDGDSYIEIGKNREKTVNSNETITIKGNEKSTVNGNETAKVDGNREKTVSGDETVTVSGNETVTISGNETAKVDGNRERTVGGNEDATVSGDQTVTVNGTLTFKVGGCTVKIDGSNVEITAGSEVKISGSTITIEGGTVNINGGAGDVKVSGISLTTHTHPGDSGGMTGTPM